MIDLAMQTSLALIPAASRGGDWVKENWRFDADQLRFGTTALALLVPVLAILAGLWLWQWSRRRALRSGPMVTFHQVATQLGVSVADEWLLLRIAQHQGLTSPLTLMLSPATLDHYTRRYAHAGRRRGRRDLLSRVGRLRARLFDDGDQDQAAAPDATNPRTDVR